MKKITRRLVLNVISLAIVSHFLPGVSYNHNYKTLIVAALILAIINLLLRPLLKVILLPINIITLGLSGWLINVLILYLTTLIVPGFNISAYSIGPLHLLGLAIPKLVFSGFWALIVASFALSLVSTFISALI